MTRFALGLVACFGTVACIGSQPTRAPAPAPATKTPAKPVAKKPAKKGLSTNQTHMGPLTSSVAPTPQAVGASLGATYTAKGPKEGSEGSTVAVYKGQELVLEVYPSSNGQHIGAVLASHKDVIFPWSTRVGLPMGKHHHWEKMNCVASESPFEGMVICNAFPAARISYLLAVDPAEGVPGKAELAKEPIAHLLWRPDAP